MTNDSNMQKMHNTPDIEKAMEESWREHINGVHPTIIDTVSQEMAIKDAFKAGYKAAQGWVKIEDPIVEEWRDAGRFVHLATISNPKSGLKPKYHIDYECTFADDLRNNLNDWINIYGRIVPNPAYACLPPPLPETE